MSVTPYRINTMTLTAHSGLRSMDISLLQNVTVFNDPNAISISHVSLPNRHHVVERRGKVYKSNGRQRRYNKQMFDNQATVVAYIPERDGHINIKLFKNGHIQMTGARSKEEGLAASTAVLRIMHGPLGPAAEVRDVKICLMNSDFRINFRVDRDKLYGVVKDTYNMWCSYNPSIYLAVKIHYMYNEHGDGLCKAKDEQCDGKKKGACCKKVTIFVFHTGAVIITGAVTLDQLKRAYDWISTVVETHKDAITYM